MEFIASRQQDPTTVLWAIPYKPSSASASDNPVGGWIKGPTVTVSASIDSMHHTPHIGRDKRKVSNL
ncbi:UNVERIFIED_CONTAM: hypothetical protein Slati_3311100 [Sesamum latifolium]|uniref:CRIB domain-containing protein n=1 Tax=Sesamum latifolium TaxID=2727402 RepID=A0AAW2V2S6_9LAMI